MIEREYTESEREEMDRRDRDYRFHRRLVLSVITVVVIGGTYLILQSDPAFFDLLSKCGTAGLPIAISRSYFTSIEFLAASVFTLIYNFWLVRFQNAHILEALVSSGIFVIIAYGLSFGSWRDSLDSIRLEDSPPFCLEGAPLMVDSLRSVRVQQLRPACWRGATREPVKVKPARLP